jgi:hypothetical protein
MDFVPVNLAVGLGFFRVNEKILETLLSGGLHPPLADPGQDPIVEDREQVMEREKQDEKDGNMVESKTGGEKNQPKAQDGMYSDQKKGKKQPVSIR